MRDARKNTVWRFRDAGGTWRITPAPELLSVFAIGMDADITRALCAKQGHRVGEHVRALVEMMLLGAVRFSKPGRRWRKGRHEIFEVQPSLTGRISRRSSHAIDTRL